MTELQKIKRELAEKDKDIRLLEMRINKLEDENQALAHDRYMAESHYHAEKKKAERLKCEIAEWNEFAGELMLKLVDSKAVINQLKDKIAKLNGGEPMPF